MQFQDLNIPREHVRKLLSTASSDTALLYLYLHSGNDLRNAAQALQISTCAVQCAAATLRQLELWTEKEKAFAGGERPSYTEYDVLQAMERDQSFPGLRNEVQQTLGRPLTTEDLKILLGFVNYLGLPYEVISILVRYCKDRSVQRGKLRAPSLRSIEKEAYHWADLCIDTMEEASAYITRQNVRFSRLGQLMETLQIRGRALTAAEERYAQQWLDWGFGPDELAIAYDRTVLGTGKLTWKYMDKIVSSWHEKGLHSVKQIESGDIRRQKNAPASTPAADSDSELAEQRRLLAHLRNKEG